MATTNTVKARLKIARKTEAEWLLLDPVGLEGEWMVTENEALKLKIGNGKSKWSALSYLDIGTGSGVADLIANRVLVSDANGEVISSDITDGELAYLQGLTSNVQTQLDNKADSSHTHDDRYYTETEVDDKLAGKSDTSHTHDDRYYTETETDEKLAGKSDTTHVHDDRYYTESEMDTILGGKSDTGHTHDGRYYTESEVDTALAKKANTSHTHVKSDITDFPDIPVVNNPTVTINQKGVKKGSFSLNQTSDISVDLDDSDTTYGNATTSSSGLMSASDKAKLDGIAKGAQVNTVTGVKGNAESSYRQGNVNITPANVGAVASSEKGAANGVVPLNESGVIDASFLPSYVDDVIEYASVSDFPTTGESGKIYVDTSAEENNTYRWSGTKYILIAKNTNTTYKITKSGSTVTLTGSDGSTTSVTDDNTTYSEATTASSGLMSSGDKTKLNGIATGAEVNQNAFSSIAIGSTTISSGSKTGSVTLVGSNVTLTPDATNKKVTIGITKQNVTDALGYTPPTTNTTYGVATTSANGLMSSTDKSKLDGIAEKANNYSLPNATASVLGGVKIGSNITVSDGTISLTKANVTNALGYTPPTTNTTYGVASTSANGLMSSTDKSKLDGIAEKANNYSLPTATSSVLGGVMIGSNITVSSGVISLTKANVTAALGYTPPTTNTTYSTGTASASGLTKLYTGTGSNTDGTMTQSAITTALNGKAASSHTHSYLPLSGGTMTGQIVKAGTSSSWVNGRSYALLKTTSCGQSAYSPIISAKSYEGSWELGPYSSNYLHLSYITDTNFSAGTNSQTADFTFRPDGSIVATTFVGSLSGNASTATKATQDSAGQQINTTYIKALSISGKVITYTKGDGTTGTITTQDTNTTYSAATSSALGLVKIGSNITVSSGTISLTKTNVTAALGYTPPTTNTTYSAATTSAAGLMSAADKTKLDGIATSANNYTHPTTSGNKHIPSGGSSGQILRWSADGTAVWGSDNNTTYSNQSLGNGYGTCATAADTVAKVGTLSGYSLVTGGKPTIKFTYAVPASATLNINSKGAKAIYYNGAAITADIIAAGDIVTFIYDGSYYHVIAIDKMSKVTQTIENDAETVPSGAALTTKFTNLPNTYLTYTVLSTIDE